MNNIVKNQKAENLEVFELFKILFDKIYLIILSIIISFCFGYAYYKMQNYNTTIEAKIYKQSSVKIDKYLNLTNKLKYVDQLIGVSMKQQLAFTVSVYEYKSKLFFQSFIELLNSDIEVAKILKNYENFDKLNFKDLNDLTTSFEIEVKNDEQKQNKYISLVIDVSNDEKIYFEEMVNFLVTEANLRMNQIYLENLENTYNSYFDIVENIKLNKKFVKDKKISNIMDEIINKTILNEKTTNQISDKDLNKVILDKEKIYTQNFDLDQKYLIKIISNLRNYIDENKFFNGSDLILFEKSKIEFSNDKHSLLYSILFSLFIVTSLLIGLIFFRHFYTNWLNNTNK